MNDHCPKAGTNRRRRRRLRGQHGFTMVEVLMTVAISSVIMVPLLAWMLLAFETQVEITDNSSETAARNLLASYLPTDVGSSATIDPAPADCAATPTPGDVPRLSMVGAGTVPVRTVYLLRPVAVRTGELIRRTCQSTSTEDLVVVERVALPATSSVVATCDDCSSRNGRVNLSVELAEDRGTISVTGSRRIGPDPDPAP